MAAPRALRRTLPVLLLGSLLACSGAASGPGATADGGASANGGGGPGTGATGGGGSDDGGAGSVSGDDGAAPPVADGAAGPDAPAPSGGGEGGAAAFVHPGVIDSRAQLDFVKGKIAAGAEPWKSALAAATASSSASLTYKPAPVADVVCGPYSNPDVGCSAEKADAAAAYTDALLWYFTGKAAYAAKAIEIMNAWSAVLTQHTNSNAPLQSAWVGSVWPRAGEILRASNAGWADADVAKFAAMLKGVYLPSVIDGAAKENGNWELSMAEATIGIGVFLDDPTTFAKGLSLWRARVPAYVYLSSDGPTPVLPPGGGVSASGLAAFWYGQTQLADGVAQETCRDLGHVQYGLAAIINGAETAHIQGVDLYGEEATRIVAGLEYHAQFLDGAAIPGSLCGGTLNAVTPDPMWEIALNEYAGRLGMTLPSTLALATKIRPTGSDHHMEWETLTHAGVGN